MLHIECNMCRTGGVFRVLCCRDRYVTCELAWHLWDFILSELLCNMYQLLALSVLQSPDYSQLLDLFWMSDNTDTTSGALGSFDCLSI